MKKAVINVQFLGNMCFAWSMVAALHPVQSYTNEELSYSYYTTVLNFKDIQFLNRNKRFENLNDISINVYDIEKQKEMTIFSLRHIDMKRDKPVNLLYVQDPRNNNVEHFV